MFSSLLAVLLVMQHKVYQYNNCNNIWWSNEVGTEMDGGSNKKENEQTLRKENLQEL